MPEQRRYLVINFRIGSSDSGTFVGPVLVSTPDYRRFHFWDEPDPAHLEPGDYQVLRIYPLGCSGAEAELRFSRDFPPQWLMVERVVHVDCARPGPITQAFLPNLSRPLRVSAV